MYHQLYGAPPYFTRNVTLYLNNLLTKGPAMAVSQNLPPQSPDLSALHFHAWGYMKTWCANVRWAQEMKLLRIFDAARRHSRSQTSQNVHRSYWRPFWIFITLNYTVFRPINTSSYTSNTHISVTADNRRHVHMTFLTWNGLKNKISKYCHKVTGYSVDV